MASLTASHLVSHVQGGGVASSADSMPNMVQIGQRTPLVTHNGLRSLNRANTLQMRNNVRSIATRWSKSPGKIICGSSGMNLVLVSAECGPWSKTGGLGDVVGGLPPALAGNGHRVMTVSPRYDQYKDAWDTSVIVEIQVGESVETVRFYHCYKRGVDRVFIDHPIFLEKVWGKTKSKIYGPDAGVDYDDNQLRFSLLCSAALEAPRVLDLTNKNFSGPYGEDVIFVANDWHTSLLPCYLKTIYKPKGIYTDAKMGVSASIHFSDQ